MAQVNNPKGRKLGLYGKDTCPRCGAPRSVQKYPKRRPMLDFSVMQLVENLHPSDGVVCGKCGFAFRVSALDVDEGYLVSEDELECIPNYCPRCSEKLFAEGGTVSETYIDGGESGSICPIPRANVIFEGQKLTFDSEDSAKFAELVRGHFRKLAGLRGDAE